MAKKRHSAVVARAWRILRLALLWARKGGAFKQRLLLDLKNLHPRGASAASNRLRYFERQFSFDETPAFHFKMHRPASLRHLRIPCITPAVAFDDDDDEIIFERCREMRFLESRENGDDEKDQSDGDGVEEGEETEDEIDSRAEKFIVEFYEQMKLQRQISYLEYDEMLQRGMR
ncbi:hypothetical protein AXF42_Ash020966 [Apostasia shenzhenica]|uniref:DUF761 domain-containing protein n=1 Tax=Apostasia shenzhenica TaxID=1088818 RepID=A0A2H9ZYN9_9ASPA|nr:hypothetical protein AXF42_Ash020966 [Apostasia shenzhenica]